MNGPKQ